jgi:hypothetical protein
MRWALDTPEHGIVPLLSIAKDLLTDLKANVGKYIAIWHDELELGDDVTHAPLADWSDEATADDTFVVQFGKITKAPDEGLAEIDGADVPTALIFLPGRYHAAEPGELLGLVKHDPSIILATHAALAAYRNPRNAGK